MGRGVRVRVVQGPWGGDRAKEPCGNRARGGCDSRVSPQAKYLAQIILVGAQVVERAFMRALRQEFAGRSWDAAPCAPCAHTHTALLGTAAHPHPSLGIPMLPIPARAHRGHCQVAQGDSQHPHPGTGLMVFHPKLGSQQPSQAPSWPWHCCQAPRDPGTPKGRAG